MLRLIAPIVVLTTVVVFASGIVLLFGGPGSGATWLPIHKVSFIVWLVFTALHVLGHLPQMPAALRAARPGEGRARRTAGDTGRWIALAGAIVGGVVLAIAVISHFGVWTTHGAFPPHRHNVG